MNGRQISDIPHVMVFLQVEVILGVVWNGVNSENHITCEQVGENDGSRIQLDSDPIGNDLVESSQKLLCY